MHAHKKQVWIIDDEIDLALLFSEYLNREFVTRVFHTAHDLLDAIDHTEQVVDVILSDIFLPDINGLDLLKQIKEKNPNILPISMSGAFNSGAIFQKPFDLDDLTKFIRLNLEGHE